MPVDRLTEEAEDALQEARANEARAKERIDSELPEEPIIIQEPTQVVYSPVPVRVLVADPPWSFSDDLPGYGTTHAFGRGARSKYPCLSVTALRDFPLPPLAQDAVLLMWKVSAMPEEAYSVIRAWGFVPKTEIVWKKLTSKGGRHFGMGRYVRAEHETCVVAARGKGHQLVKVHNVRSVFEAPVGRHSEKPEAFFDIVEQLFDGPYAELFARRRRPGWDCYGNELAPGSDLTPSGP